MSNININIDGSGKAQEFCRLMLEGRLYVVKMESISGICGGGTKTAMLIGSNDQL